MSFDDPELSIDIIDFSFGIFYEQFSVSAGNPRSSTPQTQWIEKSKYMQGSYQLSQFTQNGAATFENTYRCGPSKTGSLIPLPRRTTGPTAPLRTLFGGTAAPANFPTAAHIANFTADAMVDNQIYPVNAGAAASDLADNSAVFVHQTFWVAYSGAGRGPGNADYTEIHIVSMYTGANGSIVQDIIFCQPSISGTTNGTQTNPSYGGDPNCRIPNGFIERSRSVGSATTLPYSADKFLPTTVHGWSPCFEYNFGTIAGATTTSPIFAQALPLLRAAHPTNFPYTPTVQKVQLLQWPMVETNSTTPGDDPAVSTTATGNIPPPTAVLNSPIRITALAYHQGRVLYVGNLFTQFGTNRLHSAEFVFYQLPVLPGTNDGFIPVGENSSAGYGAVASINSNELYLVKHDGGAVIVRGDIANATIQSMPMVESTYGVACRPVVTPLGMVYVSRNGVFSWNGQSVATKLSWQLDGDFTNHAGATNLNYQGNRGRLGYWHPFVCLPNNWLYDTRTQSWWQLDNQTDHNAYNCYDTSSSGGKLYAFRWKVDTTQNVLYDTYDANVLANDFSWQSQPLLETKDNLHTYAGFTIVAARAPGGSPYITVTLNGVDEDGDDVQINAITVDLSTAAPDRPAILRMAVPNFQARYVQVRLQSNSGSGSIQAPEIKKFTLHRRASARPLNR